VLSETTRMRCFLIEVLMELVVVWGFIRSYPIFLCGHLLCKRPVLLRLRLTTGLPLSWTNDACSLIVPCPA
jgi:hypothetical protein